MVTVVISLATFRVVSAYLLQVFNNERNQDRFPSSWDSVYPEEPLGLGTLHPAIPLVRFKYPGAGVLLVFLECFIVQW